MLIRQVWIYHIIMIYCYEWRLKRDEAELMAGPARDHEHELRRRIREARLAFEHMNRFKAAINQSGHRNTAGFNWPDVGSDGRLICGHDKKNQRGCGWKCPEGADYDLIPENARALTNVYFRHLRDKSTHVKYFRSEEPKLPGDHAQHAPIEAHINATEHHWPQDANFAPPALFKALFPAMLQEHVATPSENATIHRVLHDGQPDKSHWHFVDTDPFNAKKRVLEPKAWRQVPDSSVPNLLEAHHKEQQKPYWDDVHRRWQIWAEAHPEQGKATAAARGKGKATAAPRGRGKATAAPRGQGKAAAAPRGQGKAAAVKLQLHFADGFEHVPEDAHLKALV